MEVCRGIGVSWAWVFNQRSGFIDRCGVDTQQANDMCFSWLAWVERIEKPGLLCSIETELGKGCEKGMTNALWYSQEEETSCPQGGSVGNLVIERDE